MRIRKEEVCLILDEMHFTIGTEAVFDSRDYDLIFAHLDTSDFKSLAGEISTGYIFNKRDLTKYSVGNVYTDSPVSMEVEMITYPVRDLTMTERRSIEKALFNKNDYRELFIVLEDDTANETYEVIDGEVKRFFFKCKFLNPEKITNDCGTIGYRCVMECDCGWMHQEAITKTYTFSSSGADASNSITVTVDTDTNEYTYPLLSVNIGSTGGDIMIVNQTDDGARLTEFVDISPNISLTIDGRINYVSGQNYTKFRNQNFVRLLDGINNLTVSGDVSSITVEWSNERFM